MRKWKYYLAIFSAVYAGVFLFTWTVDWFLWIDYISSTASMHKQYEFWKVFYWTAKTVLISLWLMVSIHWAIYFDKKDKP